MRAVTFQSMLRTSSPAWYSRTSANSIPCPLKTERYSPVKSELTRPRVLSSMSFTCRRISGGTPRVGGAESGRCAASLMFRVACALGVERGFTLESALSRRQNRSEGLISHVVRRSTPDSERSTLWALDLREHSRHDVVARHLFRL